MKILKENQIKSVVNNIVETVKKETIENLDLKSPLYGVLKSIKRFILLLVNNIPCLIPNLIIKFRVNLGFSLSLFKEHMEKSLTLHENYLNQMRKDLNNQLSLVDEKLNENIQSATGYSNNLV